MPLPAIHQAGFYLEACPLLRSAILLFVSRTDSGLDIFSKYQQRLISTITERNMASATRVKPTVFRVIALLILANLPPNPPSELLQPSQFQTCPLLAMDMAQHLDLDAGFRILQEMNADEWQYLDLTGLLADLCLVSTSKSLHTVCTDTAAAVVLYCAPLSLVRHSCQSSLVDPSSHEWHGNL